MKVQNNTQEHSGRLTLSTITPSNVKTLSAVNRKAGVIEGCAICTAGPALGKPYTFSNNFIQSLYDLAMADGGIIKVENGHNIYDNYTDAIIDIAYQDNLSIDKTEEAWILRGDTNFYLPESETAQLIMSKAEKQPKKFGLSIVFSTEDKYWENGGKIDKASALHGADFVGTPAANPSGLLSKFNGIPNILKHFFNIPETEVEVKTLSSTNTGEDKPKQDNNITTMKIATPMARKFLSRAREIVYTLSGDVKDKASKVVDHFDNNPLPASSSNITEVDVPDTIGNDLTDLMLSGNVTTKPEVKSESTKQQDTESDEVAKLKKELEETKLKLSSKSGHVGDGTSTTATGATKELNMLSGQEKWEKWGELMASGKREDARAAEALYESNKTQMDLVHHFDARKAAMKN